MVFYNRYRMSERSISIVTIVIIVVVVLLVAGFLGPGTLLRARPPGRNVLHRAAATAAD
jgi:hypothetical protein